MGRMTGRYFCPCFSGAGVGGGHSSGEGKYKIKSECTITSRTVSTLISQRIRGKNRAPFQHIKSRWRYLHCSMETMKIRRRGVLF
jgi:hypothetical protein